MCEDWVFGIGERELEKYTSHQIGVLFRCTVKPKASFWLRMSPACPPLYLSERPDSLQEMRTLAGALAPLVPIYGDTAIKTAVYFGLDRAENILQVSWLENTKILTQNLFANVFKLQHIRLCSLQKLSNSSEHRTVFAFNQDYADERNVAASTQDKHGLTQDMMSVSPFIYLCLT